MFSLKRPSGLFCMRRTLLTKSGRNEYNIVRTELACLMPFGSGSYLFKSASILLNGIEIHSLGDHRARMIDRIKGGLQ